VQIMYNPQMSPVRTGQPISLSKEENMNRNRGLALLSMVAITGYAALAGGGASVVRAAVMADVFFLALLVDREADLPSAIAVAGLGLALWNPAVIHDVGFLLTFAATIGIVVALDPALRDGK